MKNEKNEIYNITDVVSSIGHSLAMADSTEELILKLVSMMEEMYSPESSYCGELIPEVVDLKVASYNHRKNELIKTYHGDCVKQLEQSEKDAAILNEIIYQTPEDEPDFQSLVKMRDSIYRMQSRTIDSLLELQDYIGD